MATNRRAMCRSERRARSQICRVASGLGWRRRWISLEVDSDAALDWMEDDHTKHVGAQSDEIEDMERHAMMVKEAGENAHAGWVARFPYGLRSQFGCRFTPHRFVYMSAMSSIQSLSIWVCGRLSELRAGIPKGVHEGNDVPKDGKKYRVWTRSRVVQWEAGPNVWNDCDTCDSGEWWVNNCDGWLAEVEPKLKDSDNG